MQARAGRLVARRLSPLPSLAAGGELLAELAAATYGGETQEISFRNCDGAIFWPVDLGLVERVLDERLTRAS